MDRYIIDHLMHLSCNTYTNLYTIINHWCANAKYRYYWNFACNITGDVTYNIYRTHKLFENSTWSKSVYIKIQNSEQWMKYVIEQFALLRKFWVLSRNWINLNKYTVVHKSIRLPKTIEEYLFIWCSIIF